MYDAELNKKTKGETDAYPIGCPSRKRIKGEARRTMGRGCRWVRRLGNADEKESYASHRMQVYVVSAMRGFGCPRVDFWRGAY